MADVLRLVDTRSLAKPSPFSGKEADWAAWTFSFEAYCSLLHRDLTRRMEQACDLPEDAALNDVDETTHELSRVLFALLVSLCQGKAVNILMNTQRHNGLAG